ncbi:androgen-dependent TFPI-regulating protein-like isoform X1 [Helicoverpa zea]|uniref:androgen-dependent TFPI-regulating protein-like isoform X1 n=2 Tax=Helicoverpa zea TaxID=7113 RepID=UPI001F56AA8B|nr:androgen-dependent TFPI-regulating protein-like isoform X1 [Helicoverpa zea]
MILCIMNHHIYFRILGYLVTITMHVSNIVVMMSSFHGEVMKNQHVRHFSEMQCFFFTCWTFTFQTVHALLALYMDILTLKNSKSPDFKLPKLFVWCREALFSILVWPSTVLVVTIFWSLYLYDRQLIFPMDIDLVITKASNHVMHSCILPAVLWEVMFRRREAPRTHVWRLMLVWLTAVVYFTVLFFVHAYKGVWVYPIFGLLTGSIFFYLFIAFVFAILVPMYYSQWMLNSLIWDSRIMSKKIT